MLQTKHEEAIEKYSFGVMDYRNVYAPYVPPLFSISRFVKKSIRLTFGLIKYLSIIFLFVYSNAILLHFYPTFWYQALYITGQLMKSPGFWTQFTQTFTLIMILGLFARR